MKKSLLILAISLFATSAWAQDFTAKQTPRKQAPLRKVIPQQQRGEGAVQRGVRMGNVLQMINPFAPAEYGSGEESVSYDDSIDPFQRTTPGKPAPKGIRLFGFSF